MSPFIEYLIKLSVSLAAVSLFYQLVLRRLTFYNWNRWYFMLYTALCFFIPLIDINQSVPTFSSGIGETVIASIPSMRQITSPAFTRADFDATSQSVDYEAMAMLLVLVGTVIMTIRFAFHMFFYVRIRRNAKLVSDEDVKIYHLQKDVSPFSFGNAIYYNPDLHSPEDLKDIILHEYIHVRQRHTLDVLWSELLCIVNWFNPFAWLLRYSIRQNLEFIADRQVLANNIDARQYQYLLLKVAGVPEYRIANQFSFSSLKQRIVMMNKGKTPQLLLSLFLFSLPVIALLLAIFRNDIRGLLDQTPITLAGDRNLPDSTKKTVYIAGLVLDSETNKPVAGLPLKIVYQDRYLKTITTNAQGFYYQRIIVPRFGADEFNKRTEAARKKKKPYRIPMLDIETSYEGDEFAHFVVGDNFLFDADKYERFPVIFAVRHLDRSFRQGFYGIKKVDYFRSSGKGTPEGIFEYLTNASPAFKAENTLINDFKKANPFPKNVITKFKNGYFNRQKQLIGYENVIRFFLDGKKADYRQINEAFKNYPYMLNESNEFKTWDDNSDGLYKEIAYLTVPLYKDAAPAYIVKGNIEWKDTTGIDLPALLKEPYFLNGFRQIYGAGSNQVPEKGEIKKIALFKGKLARYYDPNSDRVWWIETRPEPEVFERPDLAFGK